MVRLKKNQPRMDSVEAYACVCMMSVCTCGCNCGVCTNCKDGFSTADGYHVTSEKKRADNRDFEAWAYGQTQNMHA